MNCSFCPGTTRPKRRMTPDEFSFVIEKLRPYTDYIYLHIMGEPLTHPDLSEIIRRGTSLGFKIAITTNGTLLDKRVDELTKSGLYKLNISLHSFEEGDKERQSDYIRRVAAAADVTSRAGILTVLRLWNEGCDEGRNTDTVSILREIFTDSWVLGARGARIRPKLHLEYGERFDWPDLGVDELGDRVFCHGLGDHFGVLSDGRVVPCCLDREGAITLGNIFEDDVESILTSPHATAIRTGFQSKCAVEELCKKCSYARRFKL